MLYSDRSDDLSTRCDAHEQDDHGATGCERCRELVEAGAIAWAEAAEVVVRPLPPEETLHAEAEAYYARRERAARHGPRGLLAFARHNYTNYEALLDALEQAFPAVREGEPYELLRGRVDEALGEALDALDWHEGDDGPG